MQTPPWLNPADPEKQREADEQTAARMGITVERLHEIDRQTAADQRARDALSREERIVDDNPKFNKGFGPLSPENTIAPGEVRAHSVQQKNYEFWTRLRVAYVPVTRGKELLGYLYGSQGGNSAGFLPRVAAQGSRGATASYWKRRLAETCAMGFTPEEAIRHFIGAPSDAECGVVAADAAVAVADTIQGLALQLNPEAPLGEGPWIQDGTSPTGSPDDRSNGWGPLVSAPAKPTFPVETSSSLVFYAVTRGNTILGYLWSAITEDAAGYLPRTAAGHDGVAAGGLWKHRLQDACGAGTSSQEALRQCRNAAAYIYDRFGVIRPDAIERSAPDLAALRHLAEQE
ncbi:hypothetical protein ACIRRA_00335 [Nocardia sp. NPDC101769]|uniref:hypothetical protein n=1 Tax=Nocardia sp. NPDC101769 TaxID=3364333 RepID=UPI0037FE9236